jgi:NADH-quinone oxidoreductase subunit F
VSGEGRLQDVDLIPRVSRQMMGRTICALSDAAAMPAISFVEKFRDEFEFFVREGRSKVKGHLHA